MDDVRQGAAARWGVALMRPPLRRLLIVGAGGHGRSVAEAVLAAGVYEVTGFADDAAPGLAQVRGYPVLGTTDDVSAYRDSCGCGHCGHGQ